MLKAIKYSDTPAAEILSTLCPLGEPVEGVEVDQDWEGHATVLTFVDGSALTINGPTVYAHPSIDALREAASADLETLSDPVGLQRTMLETVANARCTAEQSREIAGKCSGAVELRSVFDRFDAQA